MLVLFLVVVVAVPFCTTKNEWRKSVLFKNKMYSQIYKSIEITSTFFIYENNIK